MDYKSNLIDSWNRNNKVTLYLLNNIEQEWLSAKLMKRGRSIGDQFVHINNIRSFWIGKVAKKRDLKIDKKYARDKVQLGLALDRSALKMADTLNQIFKNDKIKGYNPHPLAFFSQMIAHEAHHRGQIMATITRNGLEINKSVNFGLWNWNDK